MTEPQAQGDHRDDPATADPAGPFLRFDPPHPLPHASREADPRGTLPAELEGDMPGDEEELTALQAEQLAALLRRRERDLDRREAALHARLAAIDHRLRMARLAEAAAESSLEPAVEEELAKRGRTERDLEGTDDGLPRPAADAWSRLAREQLLQLESALKQWEHDQQWVRQQQHRSERLLAEQRRAWEEEQQRREQALRQRAAELQRRQQALGKLQQDVFEVHRRTLETRLAVEQVAARLNEQAPPELLERRLAEARRQLAAHQQQFDQVLLERTGQLRQWAERLQRERDRLQSEREELRQWAAHVDGEVEAQAARLIAREQELDRRERRLRDQQLAWTRQQRNFWQSVTPLAPQAQRRPETDDAE